MMDLIELILHPSTVSFALGNLAGSWLTISLMFRMRRHYQDIHGGRG